MVLLSEPVMGLQRSQYRILFERTEYMINCA